MNVCMSVYNVQKIIFHNQSKLEIQPGGDHSSTCMCCVYGVCVGGGWGGGVVGFKCGIKFTLYLCAHLHVEVVKRRTHYHRALGSSKRKGCLRVELRSLNAFEPQCLEPLFFPHLIK